ncbi:MAG: hypothetical protein J6D47_10395 [Peptostreptococcaceae bacterium]|nr:hypothetical protein [Peptostreptococcaceae bacterium]
MSIIKTEKEIILKTIKVVAELMDNPCSFRKFLENLGLESKDYEDLYKARGMYLTNIANSLQQQEDDCKEVYRLVKELYDMNNSN